MPYSSENVCLELQKEYNIYAIGSRSHVSFIDGRLANQAIGVIKSKDRECGVRSLQFKNELISIGTGGGKVFFYDLRASNYLPSNGSQAHSTQEICSLRTTPGWVMNDATYRDFFSNLPHPANAIYTHQYSPSSSRMLLAGGPLPLGLYGNYCSVWL
jgi:WD repeat-containing protein 40A